MRSWSSQADSGADCASTRCRRIVCLIAIAGFAALVVSPVGAAQAHADDPMAAGAIAVGASAVVRAADVSEAENAPGYPWAWPLTGARTVVNPFRAPAHDYGAGHRGIDITGGAGASVHAPAPGMVAFRGVVVDRPLITIDHGGGYVSTFEPVSSELNVGDRVEPGDVIGTLSSGGHAPRGTLHVGVRVNDSYANPHPLFGAIPRAVLLPCCER